tara:strand:+ start:222 stop:356 length:135 start_codon:yes stop_codon:yes gene_type:complete
MLDSTITISLFFLGFFIILFLTWLVFKTLKEGKEALKEIKREQD